MYFIYFKTKSSENGHPSLWPLGISQMVHFNTVVALSSLCMLVVLLSHGMYTLILVLLWFRPTFVVPDDYTIYYEKPD
jgi:tellurite resistance protein TehA-like permease